MRQRRDGIILAVGAIGAIGEDHIGRDMDERDFCTRAGVGEMTGAGRVNGDGLVALTFGLVDGGVGGGVDDDVGRDVAECAIDGLGHSKIEIGSPQKHRAPMLAFADFREVCRQLTSATDDKSLIGWLYNGLVRFRPGSADPKDLEPDLAERAVEPPRSQSPPIAWSTGNTYAVGVHDS